MGRRKTNKPEEKVKKDETVAEEETVTEETETEEEAAEDQVEEETETESEDEEEVKTDEAVDATVETASAEADVTKFAVTQNGRVVKVFNATTHGPDFAKIAANHAKRLAEKNPGATFKAVPVSDTVEEIIEKDVAVVVNASNSIVRKFSLAAHGEEYAKLAEGFVAKHPKRGYRVL